MQRRQDGAWGGRPAEICKACNKPTTARNEIYDAMGIRFWICDPCLRLHQNLPPPPCTGCGMAIDVADRIDTLGRRWHTKCFTCYKCHVTFKQTNFQDHSGFSWCIPCHEQEMARKEKK